MTDQPQGTCPSCGTQVQPDARFCSNCGQVLGENAPPNPPEENVIETENVSVPPLPNTENTTGSGAGRVIRNVAIGCGGLLVVLILLVVIVGLIVGGSGSGGDSGGSANGSGSEQVESEEGGSEEQESQQSGETFTNENYGELVADPESYDGANVNITGQLLGAPETSGGETAFQIYADAENYEQNTIVYYPDTDVDLAADDYVRVQGTAGGTFEGENAFGASLEAVAVEADSIKVISAAEAVDPTIKGLEVKQTDEDQGFTVTLNRVEFGERTTRAYVSITNNTQQEVSFYTFDSRILQGSAQIDVDDSYLYELSEPQTDIAPGVTTEGAVVFGAADPTQPMRFEFEWSSYDFNITPAPVTFEVSP